MKARFFRMLEKIGLRKPEAPKPTEKWLGGKVGRINEAMEKLGVDLEAYFGHRGRTASIDPRKLAAKNGQIFSEKHGVLWWGDLAHREHREQLHPQNESEKAALIPLEGRLKHLANRLGCAVHVLHEGDNPKTIEGLRQQARISVQPD